MKCRNRTLTVIFTSVFFILGAGSNFAQSQAADGHRHTFGIGHPNTAQDLPPGQLRKSLEGLPPKARGKALGWLKGFSFPAEDVKHLRVSADGSVLYADTLLPDVGNADVITGEAETITEAVSAAQVFRLHSKPGASNVVYLDFDGHTIEGTAWNTNGNVLVALPFDPSQNDSPATVANFTQLEMDRIAIIWHRMAEDYAAFDIDVTTEEPAVFTSTTGRVLFTHDVDAGGQAMPLQNAGGVAYVNVFGRSDYVTRYSPAFVYTTNLSGTATYSAEAGSHEFGHNLGLSHDGIIGGTGYYRGSGSGEVDWAPIMGNAYYAIVTQWSQGEYADANNTQDDLAIIAGHLGYTGDDHGDSAAQATALVVEANGDILVSSPEFDPDNVLSENKGIIDDRSVSWVWKDARGATVSTSAAFTSKLKEGTYDFTLTVTDNDGATDSTSISVSVAKAPNEGGGRKPKRPKG